MNEEEFIERGYELQYGRWKKVRDDIPPKY
jgi:hypothetical protein